MKEIATEAGVTTSAVSLAFTGKPGVSPDTRAKIMLIAKRLGYTTDPFTSALMTNRRKGKLPASSPVLAFVSAHETSDGWRKHSKNFIDYFSGASDRAAEKGYRLEPFWIGNAGRQWERVCNVLYTRNIDGLLLAPLPDSIHSIDLAWEKFHSVAIGISIGWPALDRVSCDHLQSMMMATRRCHALGYRRIGIVLTRGNHERVDRRWLAAYLLDQARLPEVENVQPLIVTDWRDDIFFRWLDRERPDAVMGHSGEFLLQKLQESGRRAPEDIGLVSLNSAATSDISGIYDNPRRIGARAVDLLIRIMGRRERGLPTHPITLAIDGIWIPGVSLRNDLASSAPLRLKGIEEPDRSDSISMRDVARRAGVHPATVSLSFRNHPRIPEATRARVLAAAEELGYHKNPYISDLMRGKRLGKAPRRRPVLAFLTTYPTRDGWRKTSFLFYQYFLGARRRAATLGFQLEEIWLSDFEKGPALCDELRAREVQGLLLPPLIAAGMPLLLRWERFCMVAFGFTLEPPRLHRVANDGYHSMQIAIRECHRLGYSRIGFALSTNSDARVQNRWTAAFLMHRRENPDGLLENYLLTEEWNEQSVRRWLEKENPDLILTPQPDEFLRWLPSWGYSIPGDFGLASLNCQMGGPLSGIDQNGELLGSHAVDMLAGLIERNDFGIPSQPQTLLLHGAWNPGETVSRRA